MSAPDKPLNPALYNPDGTPKSFKGQIGGPRPGAGRPKGSINGPQAKFKALARQYTEPAIKELVRMAGFAPKINPATGEQEIDKNGNPLFLPGSSSDTARIAAINILLERGWGKATQKLAGDDTEAPIRNEQITTKRVIVAAGNMTDVDVTPSNSDEATEEDREEEKRA